ncbi:hypothetical protein C8J56DRAFT_1048088 [Mycena floridula]|nr:hypothetical protein C8J56DRAFT_1048088 [Mycena floridula]
MQTSLSFTSVCASERSTYIVFVQILALHISNHPEYRDLVFDVEALAQLPENSSVVDRIPACQEVNQASGAVASGPTEASDTSDDPDPDNQVTLGGVINLGTRRTTEIDQLRDSANNALSHPTYEQHIINAPAVLAEPIPEQKPGYITCTFPTLFPNSQGDFWANHICKVKLGDYFGHLM